MFKGCVLPSCKFNEGVACEKQSKCVCCGFEPHEHARRLEEIRSASARGELIKREKTK